MVKDNGSTLLKNHSRCYGYVMLVTLHRLRAYDVFVVGVVAALAAQVTADYLHRLHRYYLYLNINPIILLFIDRKVRDAFRLLAHIASHSLTCLRFLMEGMQARNIA